MNIATSLGQGKWSTDWLRDYKFRRVNQMCANPSRIKETLGLAPVWYGHPRWDVRDGGEDIEQLEFFASERLERAGLTPLEVADLEAVS